MKRCPVCGEIKELSQFNKSKRAKDGRQYNCRQCDNKDSTKHNREVLGQLPMAENKACASYLGVAVAERLVRHLFDNIVRMPYGNPGFDFICNQNKKIDVKSACIIINNKKNSRWSFKIDKNQIADYFLLLAFDNRDDLNPLHQWLIPGKVLNHLINTGISPSTIQKWDKYKQPVESAQICCNTIRESS